MQNKYDNINSPEELLAFMVQYFRYGYKDNKDLIHFPEEADYESLWFDNYVLQSDTELLKTKVGNCFDAVEFERSWFKNHDYEFKTIFEMVQLDYTNCYPMHSYLIYKDESDNWNYFEWADYDNRGIYCYKTLTEALDYQLKIYIKRLKCLNISSEEIKKIIRTCFPEPPKKCGALKYIEFTSSEEIV